MKFSKLKKWLGVLCAAVLATGFGAGAIATSTQNGGEITAKAATDEVSVKELMDRYGIDYVIGPYDSNTWYTEKGEKYTLTSESDSRPAGYDYTNPYGISESKYFDEDAYLYYADGEAKTQLQGWQPGIRGFDRIQGASLLVNGKKRDSSDETTYIYSQDGYMGGKPNEIKYMIVVPDSVTTLAANTGYRSPSDTTYISFNYFNLTVFKNPEEANGGFTGTRWQPRERLAGIYFTNNSSLTTIAEGESTGTENNDFSRYPKTALLNHCNNMRFCILPDGLETVGAYGVSNCDQLKDLVIPNSINYIGNKAFAHNGIRHLSIPALPNADKKQTGNTMGTQIFEGCSNLREVECNAWPSITKDKDFNDCNNIDVYENSSKFQSNLFVIGNDSKDTGTDAWYFYNKNGNWSALGLAGKEYKSEAPLYRLPDGVPADTATAVTERRTSILWDYINPDRTKQKNSFTTDISTYTIANSACNGTWCKQIIIPDAVTAIGDFAFLGSRLQYLEIGKNVQTVGDYAFAGNTFVLTDLAQPDGSNKAQYYYIHGDTARVDSWPTTAFMGGSRNGSTVDWNGEKTKRYFIFDDAGKVPNTTEATSLFKGTEKTSIEYRYEIPVKAVVESSSDIEIDNRDMENLFFADPDYGDRNPTLVTGSTNRYTITYTKRLSGLGFDYIKQMNKKDSIYGSWARNANTNDPNIVGNDSTQWYTTYTPSADDKYSGQNKNAAQANYSSSGSSVSIYTKKIEKPTVENQTYVFDGSSKSFLQALKISGNTDELSAAVVGYWITNAQGVEVKRTDPVDVLNVGRYVIRVNPAEKWGVWKENVEATVTVTQQEIDLGDLEKVFPDWSIEGGNKLGDSMTLYYYEEDGSYSLYKKSPTDDITPISVINSYTRKQNRDLTLVLNMPAGENRYTAVSVTGNSETTGRISKEYTARYTFAVKPIWNDVAGFSNYKFVYRSWDENQAEFDLRQVSKYTASEYQVTIVKKWYIVDQQNWLINQESAAGSDNAYTLVADKADNSGAAMYEWVYGDNVYVKIPKLANGDGKRADNKNIKFSVLYRDEFLTGLDSDGETPTLRNAEGTDKTTPESLGYYINNYMPVGVYTVTIYAPAATGADNEALPEFQAEIRLNVKPKKLDANAVKTITDALGKSTKIKTFEFPVVYSEGGAATLRLPDVFNAGLTDLNTAIERDTASRTGYWAAHDEFYGIAELSYNLDRLQSSEYFNAADLAGLANAPKGVDKYNVYYCISALNYEKIGGEDIDGETATEDRRIYQFMEIIYRELSAEDIFDSVVRQAGNLTYTGNEVKPEVPFNQYYNHAFATNQGYKNATAGGYTFTVTVHDPELSRWAKWSENKVRADRGVEFLGTSGNGNGTVTFRYRINAATNTWITAPQVSAWVYNGFNKDTHKFISKLRFDVDTQYSLWEEVVIDEMGNTEWRIVSLGGSDGWFSVDEKGVIVDDENGTLRTALSNLDAKTYQLRAKTAPLYAKDSEGHDVTDTVNVSAISDYMSMNITILQATNTWTKTPQISAWTWGLYPNSGNPIKAQTLYESENIRIRIYKVTESRNEAGEIVKSRSLVLGGEDGISLFEYNSFAQTLERLDAGSYELEVFIPAATTDKNWLNAQDQTVEFVVGQAQNAWDTSPNMIGWAYGRFTVNGNFTGGEPHYRVAHWGDAANRATNVIYKLYAENVNENTTETPLYTFIFRDGALWGYNADTKEYDVDLTDVLNEWAEKTNGYTLIAFYEGNDNYSDLKKVSTFRINEGQNAWNPAPKGITFTYRGFVDSAWTTPLPSYGTPTFSLTDASNKEFLPSGEISLNNDGRYYINNVPMISFIENLAAGTYTFTVSVAGYTNEFGEKCYSAIEARGYTIKVNQIETRWGDENAPKTSESKFYDSLQKWLKDNAPAEGQTDTRLDKLPTWTVHDEDKELENEEDRANAIGSIQFIINNGTPTDATGIFGALQNLKAGTYNVRISVTGRDNYTDLSAETVLNINRHVLTWGSGNDLLISAKYSQYYDWAEFKVSYQGVEGLVELGVQSDWVFSLNDTDVGNYEALKNAIMGVKDADGKYTQSPLSAGRHSVVVTVPATDIYGSEEGGALTKTISFVIDKGSNSWSDSNWNWTPEYPGDVPPAELPSQQKLKDGFVIDGGKDSDGNPITIPVKQPDNQEHPYIWWEWGSEITWSGSTVAQGSDVVVEVFKADPAQPVVRRRARAVARESEVTQSVIYLRLPNKADGKFDQSALNVLNAQLKGLPVGVYTFRITAEATENYDALVESTNYEIVIAKNGWYAGNNLTTIDGSGIPQITGWTYGSMSPMPMATPIFGAPQDVVFTYAPAKKDADGNVIYKKDAEGNILYLVSKEGVKYPIAEADESAGWTTQKPSESGTWCVRGVLTASTNYTGLEDYTSFTINAAQNGWSRAPSIRAWTWDNFHAETHFFYGAALSNGQVTYKLAVTKADFTGNTISDEELEMLTGGFAVSQDMVVSAAVQDLLNRLKPGKTYTYTVSAAAGNNYNALNDAIEGTLEIGMASNDWTTWPSVSSFAYGANEVTFVSAVPKYGTAEKVGYMLDNAAISDLTTLLAQIKGLAAGSHTLTVSLAAGDSYDKISTPVSFQVFKAQNVWQENQSPADNLEILYVDLQALRSLNGTFAKPMAQIDANTVKFSYRQGSGAWSDECSYDALLNVLKGLPAGTYTLRSKVEGEGLNSNNYYPLVGNTTLEITRQANKFKNLPENNTIGGQWKDNNQTTIDNVNIGADFGGDSILYRLSGSTNTYTYAQLKALATTFDAGSYAIEVSVPDNQNEYAGITETLTLTIQAAKNGWQDGFVLADSFKNVFPWGDVELENWTGAKPLYGHSAYVRITAANDSTHSLHYITIDSLDDETFEGAVASIITAMKGLNVGDYVFEMGALADTNWDALSDTMPFKITPADNRWTVDPAMSKATWIYNTQAGTPSATALHGSPVFTYYAADGTLLGNTMPTDAGTYKVGFSVLSTNSSNYKSIEEKEEDRIAFTIEKALLREVEAASGFGWTWHAYDRTRNLFASVPASGGAVTYSVMSGEKVVEIGGKKLENIVLGADSYVTKEVGELLNEMTAGAYILRLDVAETKNYQNFSRDVNFNVSVATNTWRTTPQVVTWAVNHWDEDKNTPIAVPNYGAATIEIRSVMGNRVYYRYNAETGKVEVSRLQDAGAGSYRLFAFVEASDGQYTGLRQDEENKGILFEIFYKGSTQEKNEWIENPQIYGWTAKEAYTVPTATPLRGYVYYSFYKAGDDGKRGALVTDKDVSIRVDVDEKDGIFQKTYYVPVEPGTYFMVAHADYYDAEGNIVTDDHLDSSELQFIISKRKNSFVEEPRIDTLLYLGDKENWVAPTAKALDGEPEFSFRIANTQDTPTKGWQPTEPGEYELLTIVHAEYTEDLEATPVRFTVKLSQNAWITAPIINDWSEEVEPNNPFAEAQIGIENIVYTYARADAPDEILPDGKPMTEGSYILYAKIHVDGYEDLTAKFDFTITPAFDRQLVVIDIILGTVACVFTVVVIILARRRYKQC